MKIHLFAFRGTGFRDPHYQAEPTLIKAGHVGLQCEGDTVIYGFHPTPAAMEAAGGEELLVDYTDDMREKGAVTWQPQP